MAESGDQEGATRLATARPVFFFIHKPAQTKFIIMFVIYGMFIAYFYHLNCHLLYDSTWKIIKIFSAYSVLLKEQRSLNVYVSLHRKHGISKVILYNIICILRTSRCDQFVKDTPYIILREKAIKSKSTAFMNVNH